MATGYEWQEEVFVKWYNNNLKGVVHADPATGKTHAGKLCLEQYLSKYMYPLDLVWVVANTKEVLNQWKMECADLDSAHLIEYYTYLGAVNRFEKLKREGKEYNFPNCLVLDECHCVNAPQSGRVLSYGVEHILGLSGTPNGSEKKLGGIIERVTFEQGNIADTTVHQVLFQPTQGELYSYNRFQESIDKHMIKFPYANLMNDVWLQRTYIKRRQICYNFKSRMDYAIALIKKNLGRKQMIFCMLQGQARALSKKLDELGIDNTLHLSNHEGLSKFISGKCDICISCKKLSVGFSYTPAEVGILVSTATSELHVLQELARVIRPAPDKHADVYILLAKNTSDMEILKKDIFIKNKRVTENIEQVI